MRRNRALQHLLWLWFLGGLALADPESGSQRLVKRQTDASKRVVCYFVNWAVYRSGTAKFTPQNINPYLCTHLVYAFGGLGKDDTIQPFDKYQDIEKGGYGQFAALKTYNRDLKTLIALGGWNEASRRFSPLVADPSRRRTFIKNAIRFLRQYNFDGLDLDWEYPTLRDGGRPEDRANYAKFVQEMREAFESEAEKTGKERLLVTMAVPASLDYAGKGYDIAALDKYLDFFNLLTYDYHSSQEQAVNHHSPLFRPKDISEFDFRANLNIDSTIKFYIKSGASRDKLVLGIPTYGRSYTLANPDAYEIGSPASGPGEKGPGTKEDGYLAYYEICKSIKDDGWEVQDPYPGVMGPYAHKDKTWVGYDNPEMAMEKAYYVAEEGLGGIMFWTIDNDDFRGDCGDRPYPIIESAKEALYGKEAAFKTAKSTTTSLLDHTADRVTQTETGIDAFHPFNTPAPPTTPSSAPDYKCENEGFFPHTTSCKKYFWCLAVPGNGMVAHTFTCPQSLYFNTVTGGCDFRRNIDCAGKDESDSNEETTTTTKRPEKEDDNEKQGQSLEDILKAIRGAGGLEAFEDELRAEKEAKEAARRREDERRQDISKKTRNRLRELLDRKREEESYQRNTVQDEDGVEVVGRISGGVEQEEEPSTLRPHAFRPKPGARQKLRNILHQELEGKDSLEADKQNEPSNASVPSEQNLGISSKTPRRLDNRQRVPPTVSSRTATESKVQNLQYVTINRGSRTGHPRFLTDVISVDKDLEDTREQDVFTESPDGDSTTGRNLEYVTIQRGSRPIATTPSNIDDNIQDSEEVTTSTLPNLTSATDSPPTTFHRPLAGIFSRPAPEPEELEQKNNFFTVEPTTFRPSNPRRLIFEKIASSSILKRPEVSQVIPAVDESEKNHDEVPTGIEEQLFASVQQPKEQISEPEVLLDDQEIIPITSPVVDHFDKQRQSRPRALLHSLRPKNVFTDPAVKQLNRNRNRSRTVLNTIRPPSAASKTTEATTIAKNRDAPISITRPLVPIQNVRNEQDSFVTSSDPTFIVKRPSTTTTSPSEYYYYDDDEPDLSRGQSLVKAIDDYDLSSLMNKVEMGPNGVPVCQDVGVFPHPHTCSKFITCSRRSAGGAIVGWEYDCPAYLAFDPVGGRCNWATDVVCN